MPSDRRHPAHGRAALVGGLAVVAAVGIGCRPKEGIRTYTVANEPQPARAAVAESEPAPPRGEPRDRMVAAIVPADDRVWFLKATGPIDSMSSVEPPVDEFLGGVRLEGGEPRWDLPEGWDERPANGMRLATLAIPADGTEEPIELTVIGLPLTGDWDAQVLDNVNRWRKQLGLSAWSADEATENTKQLDAAEGATLFDATGWFESGGMTPPFASAARPTRPSPPAAPPRSGSELSFDTPDGWENKPGSPMRKASFSTAAGAEVTAFAFPAAAPAMADPLANVDRWRREVGLGPTTQDELDDEAERIELSGGDATYIEIRGPSETTLAAMTKRGPQVWFFKLRGPTDGAASDREAFRGWLDSIEIPE